MARKKKKGVPLMLIWSRRDQQRFIEAVERFQSLVNDMERVLEPVKRKKAAAAAADGGARKPKRNDFKAASLNDPAEGAAALEKIEAIGAAIEDVLRASDEKAGAS